MKNLMNNFRKKKEAEEASKPQGEAQQAQPRKVNYNILTGRVEPQKHDCGGVWYIAAEAVRGDQTNWIPQGIQSQNGFHPHYFPTKADAQKQAGIYKKLIKWEKDKAKKAEAEAQDKAQSQ